ncbi:MAG: glycine cleavage system protein H [Bacteroides sp. SM1_62]|jgi:glycine cleavage system H protein|nr:MAG: glycine cleavage system protein H [Bacteroides sp. SM23_62]KPL25866.1 MAG: glycine cleavage system protein H [Bacteroides sp. SM1_62]
MNVPDNCKYTDKHEWIRIEGDEGYIGITDYAQGELGDIVYIEIETEGEKLALGDAFGTIEAVKTVSDLFMPVSGEILEFNSQLEDEAELVNKDPYGEGWMIRVSINNPAELDTLLSPEQYRELISA